MLDIAKVLAKAGINDYKIDYDAKIVYLSGNISKLGQYIGKSWHYASKAKCYEWTIIDSNPNSIPREGDK